jgi:uncharacterized protein YndB with AHSA1/START domain
MHTQPAFDPKLNLQLARDIDVPRHWVWRAYTEPALLMHWFCPKPWRTVACDIDLRPGGVFNTTMRSPEGQDFPNLGCYLELVPNERLVWTNALLPGFRPSPSSDRSGPTCGDASVDFKFTACIALADHAGGTRYTATVLHADEAGCQQHAAMGFEAGWGAALDQLVAMVKAQMRT